MNTEVQKNKIREDFFVVVIRDARPKCRWISCIGKKKAIDILFDWCRANLGYDDTKWFGIYFHDDDAIVLDLHIFDNDIFTLFFKQYGMNFLPDDRPTAATEAAEVIQKPEPKTDLLNDDIDWGAT